MPFIAGAVAAVVTAVSGAVAAVTSTIAAGLFAAGLSDGLAIGIAGALVSLAGAAALTVGLEEINKLLFHSKVGAYNQVLFKADPNAGIPYVVGRTGVGGNIVFADTSTDGHNTWLHYFTVLSHGPVDAVEAFLANNVPVTFASTSEATHVGLNWRAAWSGSAQYQVDDGVAWNNQVYICVTANVGYEPNNTDYWAAVGQYAGPNWIGKMWQLVSLGQQPDVYLTHAGWDAQIPEWGPLNKLSGLCSTRWVLQSDPNAFPTGSPAPLWIVRGPPIYDPREDSTYPGGSGTQRWNDWTTWGYSENPYLHALTWCLGRTNNGIRVLGLGATIANIDVAAFVNGANVADANGWKAGGQVFSTDSKWDVLTAMLAAGSGVPMRQGALISCHVDTPLVSIATLTGADFSGPVTVQGVVARKDRINQVVATYRSPAHQWQNVAADPVNVAAYIAADGTVRSKGMQMPLVQTVAQAAVLARYAIENSREFGPVTGQLLPKWLGLRPGDCVTVVEPELGMNGQTLLILDRKIDPASASPTLTCRSETGAKHAFALGQTGVAPPAPNLTGVDLVAPAPNSPPWSAVGQTITANGVATPAIVVTGVMESPSASNLIIRTRLSAGPGPWEHCSSPPAPVASRTVITGVGSGEVRDIGLSYLVRGIQGAELVIPAVAAGIFAGSGAGAVNIPTAMAWPDFVASGAGAQSVTSPAQAFAGINVPIVLALTFTGAGSWSYIQNGAAAVPFASGATLTVHPGDALAFTVSSNSTTSGILTVTDATSSWLIDAPTYSLTVTSNVVTPGPVDWPDIYAASFLSTPAVGAAGAQTFSGINVPITLSMTFTGTEATISYSWNGGAWVAFATGQTLVVNPGDTLDFQASSSVSTGLQTITVSSGGAVIDAFTYALKVSSKSWP